jgi:hypothetical protein
MYSFLSRAHLPYPGKLLFEHIRIRKGMGSISLKPLLLYELIQLGLRKLAAQDFPQGSIMEGHSFSRRKIGPGQIDAADAIQHQNIPLIIYRHVQIGLGILTPSASACRVRAAVSAVVTHPEPNMTGASALRVFRAIRKNRALAGFSKSLFQN